MGDSGRLPLASRSGNTAPYGPTGYILSYGLSYKSVVYKGTLLEELPACPRSATAAHDAFVSKCRFSTEFSPTLDKAVTKNNMIEDVRRAAMTMASGDVVVVFFSGNGERMDGTACVIDGAGGVVSVRKLQAEFAKVAVDRGVRDVALVVILDCCQVLRDGKPVSVRDQQPHGSQASSNPRLLAWCR